VTSHSIALEQSRTTAAILNLVQKRLNPSSVLEVGCGLPAGSRHLTEQRLVLAGTVCTVPLFSEAMLSAVRQENADVVLARHGTFPEVFDAVLWDAVLRVTGALVQLEGLILFADQLSNYWLVPSQPGPYVRLAKDGLHLDFEPPFITWSERCDGVCRAAKHIIGVTRTGQGF
jgi:hypothetical protein